MKAYLAFTKKEFLENLRTYKVLIMIVVFVLFGIMSPALAKLMPDILKSAMPANMQIKLPTPTAFDSWGQFFKNVGQMGMLVLVIVFSGIMSNEFSRGTLINILTKGMRRSTVILSKWTAAVVIWTMSYLICFMITYFYTAYFWKLNSMHHMFLTFFSMWLFGVLLIVLLLLGGILFKNIYGSLLLTGAAVMMMMILAIDPKLQKYNPIILASENMSLLTAQKGVSDFTPAVSLTAAFIMILTVVSVLVFNKKQL